MGGNVCAILTLNIMAANEQIAEILRGYARANEFLELERLERLSHLSSEESRAIFAELVEFRQETSSNDTQPEQMLSWRLETLISVRQAFKELAQVKGWT